MTDVEADRGVAPAPSARDRVRRRVPVALAVVAFVVVSLLVLPRMDSEGSPGVATFDINGGQILPGARIHGAVSRNVYGFVVRGFRTGSASFTVPTPMAGAGQRTLLFVTAGGGPGLSNDLSIVDRSGTRHLLGHPVRWSARSVDISPFVGAKRTRLTFSARNSGATPELFADQVRVVSYTPSAVPTAGRWEVAGWIALAVVLGLVALRRPWRDAVVAVAAGLTVFIVWPSVVSAALEPLQSDLWAPAVHASWLDLDTGLLSGTYPPRSSLAVQLFHALTPITGTGVTGARTASMLVGVLAVIAIYVLGRRLAGVLGGVTTVTCALLSDPFRLSLSTGDSTGTLVLAASLFLIAVHNVLIKPDRQAMIALGVAGAVAILAEPLWWPGVLFAIVLLALRHAPKGARRAALAASLLALLLVSLPSRVSVAHQAAGDANADVARLSTATRNTEFVGRGHGAPADPAALAADPSGGPPVGLSDYVLGDHSASVVIGSTLSGAYEGLSATASRPETKLFGLLAFIIEIVGVVLLLALPRLRLLVLIPAMLAVVPWFFEDRGAVAAFLAGTAFWPALLVGAATVAHVAWGAASQRTGATRLNEAVHARAESLAQHVPRRARPDSP